MHDDRLIVALDYHDMKDVKLLVEQLDSWVNFYKVGMELFYSIGKESVSWLKSNNKKVFLDLKLHDIPNTVSKGLTALLELQPDIINIHASGGYDMMKESAINLKEAALRMNIACPKLIAVTVLTSIDEKAWEELGYSGIISDTVKKLSFLAKKAGLDGVVASAHEANNIRSTCGKDFLIVTPGIRLPDSLLYDQSRVATPKAAIDNGATHLVIGRPIYAAKKPRLVVETIIKDLGGYKL